MSLDLQLALTRLDDQAKVLTDQLKEIETSRALLKKMGDQLGPVLDTLQKYGRTRPAGRATLAIAEGTPQKDAVYQILKTSGAITTVDRLRERLLQFSISSAGLDQSLQALVADGTILAAGPGRYVAKDADKIKRLGLDGDALESRVLATLPKTTPGLDSVTVVTKLVASGWKPTVKHPRVQVLSILLDLLKANKVKRHGSGRHTTWTAKAA